MLTRTRQLITKSKTVLVSSVVLTTMIVSLGVAVPSSSALGSSAFCQLMFTYKPVSAPTSITKSNYRSWANATLPFFEKLAADAPNTKTKNELDALVKILKYEANASSAKALEAYVAANSAAWAKGGKALANAILSCVG